MRIIIVSQTLPVIRLDMDTFILAGPEATDNTCLYDQFYVTGGSVPVSTVCGTNSGAHSKSVERHDVDITRRSGYHTRIALVVRVVRQ